jgi:polyphosphate kinase
MAKKTEKKRDKDLDYIRDRMTFIPSVEPQEVPKDADLNHPSLYFNHELSWMDFNWRVFCQALDPRTPVLERVRFIAITANNLDEFIQKRVGGLKRQQAAGVTKLSPDGRTPTEQLVLVRDTALRMMNMMTRVWEKELVPVLNNEVQLEICQYDDLTAREKANANKYFHEHIYPILTPLAVDPGHPFPLISNLSLSLAIEMKHPLEESTHFARVKVPASHGRFYFLEKGKNYRLLPIEQIIMNNIQELFKGMEIESIYPFRITRNADVRRDEEEAEDLLGMISEELRERRFAPVVRLEVVKEMSDNVLNLLIRELDLEEDDIYKVDGLLDLSDCFEIADLNIPSFTYKPWEPVIAKPFVQTGESKENQDIFFIIRRGDELVYHPYDSFTATVQRFVEEAASDPKVIAIKQTLYRTSKGSPIVKALMKAAESGKQVAVLVEVKARFDEAKNIEFGQMLENAGVHVTYGLVGLKTHCKVTLVVREEADGPHAYCHIGTGNYHAQTARLYTDIGLFSCNKEFGEDLVNLFHYLTGHAPDQSYKHFIVAPTYMRNKFYELIEKEIESHKKYNNGRIICKMNALDDVGMIKWLYLASQAGVKIDLIIRGHTRMRPGLANYSENIRIISIIGRFLEHDRIFYFHNNDNPMVFIGSADWRRRNLNDRVEAIIPILQPRLRNRLIYVLEQALIDNRLAWDLHSDGRYTLRIPQPKERKKSFHKILMKRAMRRTGSRRELY